MKKFINKYFPLKFKVRVHNYIDSSYSVQYCHYRFIPLWFNIEVWMNSKIFLQDEIENGHYSPWLGHVKIAENVATRFKTINDVNNWIESQKERETNDKIDQKKLEKQIKDNRNILAQNSKEFWHKAKPYNNKIIIK